MKTKKSIIILLALTMIITSLLSACSPKNTEVETPSPEGESEVDLNEPVNLDFATFSMGSIWYSYGATIAEVMREGLPAGSRINMLDRAGGIGNGKLVGDGTVPLGLCYPPTAIAAIEGEEPYTDKKREDIRSIAGGFDRHYLGIISSKKSGINNLKEMIEGKKKVNFKALPTGGQGEQMTRFVLNSYGVGYDDIKSWGGSVEQTDFNAILDAFKDGKADMFMQTISKGHPAVTELAITTPINFLSLDEENIQEICDKYGFFRAEIPVGTFNGQDYPVPSLALSTNLITHKDVSEEVVYRITKALIEGAEKLQKCHNSLAEFDPAKAANPEYLGAPLHPGAERYYKEVGMID